MTPHLYIVSFLTIIWLALVSIGGIVLGYMTPKSRGWFIPIMFVAGIMAVWMQYYIFGLAGSFRIISTLLGFIIWGASAEFTSRHINKKGR